MRLLSGMLGAVAVLLLASLASAQFGIGGNASISSHMARPDSFDGRFHYCRAVYRMNPTGDGGNWLTDYPLADRYLSVRLSELTKIRVSIDRAGEPRHVIVRLTDDELFQCPFIMMQEVGRLFFTEEDAARLRLYLLKGGFLWVDDFWGSYAWEVWASQIRKVLPPSEYPILDWSQTTRCSVPCSTCARCRRFPASTSGTAAAAAPRSAGPTAPRCTLAGSRTSTAA